MPRAPSSWLSNLIKNLEPELGESGIEDLSGLRRAAKGVFWYPSSGSDFTPLGLDYLDDLPGFHLASGDRARGGQCLLLWMTDINEQFEHIERSERGLEVYHPEGELQAIVDLQKFRRFGLPLGEPVETPNHDSSVVSSIPVKFFRVQVRARDGAIRKTRSYWVCFSKISNELFLTHVILPYRVPVRAVSLIRPGGDQRFHTVVLPEKLEAQGPVAVYIEDAYFGEDGQDGLKLPPGFHKTDLYHNWGNSPQTLWLRSTELPAEDESTRARLLSPSDGARSCFVSSVSFDLQHLVRLSYLTTKFIYAGKGMSVSHARWHVERQIAHLGLQDVLRLKSVGEVFRLGQPLAPPEGSRDQTGFGVELWLIRQVGTEERKLQVQVLCVDQFDAYKHLFTAPRNPPLVLCTIGPKRKAEGPSEFKVRYGGMCEEEGDYVTRRSRILQNWRTEEPDLKWGELLGHRGRGEEYRVPKIWLRGDCMWIAQAGGWDQYRHRRRFGPYRYRRPKERHSHPFSTVDSVLRGWYTGQLNHEPK